MTHMSIHFHGVRGSLASPGARTSEVGGNTSCVEITIGDQRILLDAGTGLRRVGERLAAGGPSDTSILLSHLHWDHIQGLPFFPPLYIPGNTVRVMSGPNGVMPLADALRRQMSAPFFPVALDDVRASLAITDLRPDARFAVGEIQVQVARLNHPDPVYGYRLDVGGRSVVYATDTEHFSCVDPALRRLADGADVLIYDAQYLPEEYSGKLGWGHSTYEAACQLARAAGVGSLILFHHDPMRSDEDVGAIEQRAQAMFARSRAAREGLAIHLPLSGASGEARPEAA